ncbi:MAG: hypothetical protein IJU35_04430 [Paludibacteraceae bacterium]|nr:hypothetical protein [Paludibacteraceae bacterium]
MKSDLANLMAVRVKRILLVCNNYDSFVLEEDGRIDVQIAQENAELNLSNPPSIIRTETTDAAVAFPVANGMFFDCFVKIFAELIQNKENFRNFVFV